MTNGGDAPHGRTGGKKARGKKKGKLAETAITLKGKKLIPSGLAGAKQR